MEKENKIVLFEEKKVRKLWHNNEWWFVVNDVVQILTESVDPAAYMRQLKRRDPELAQGALQNVTPLAVKTEGGKQKVNCANTKILLRIIQSIPSPKAEPFKMWLSEVGYQHIQEIENPELGFERLKEIYKAKGYPDEWIERRLQSIETRKQLTDEWKARNVKEGMEYSILTAEIAKATFGLTPSQHKELKGLEKPTENLRDHMTPLELIFTALSEEATRQVAIRDDAHGFEENHEAAQKGGNMAGKARKMFEKDNVPVVSNESYLKKIKQSDKPTELKEQKDTPSV